MHELQRQPEKLTISYLQGFYLGKVHRGAGSYDMPSEAERLLYGQFDKLPEPFEVFHSVRWITHKSKLFGAVGEAACLPPHVQHHLVC